MTHKLFAKFLRVAHCTLTALRSNRRGTVVGCRNSRDAIHGGHIGSLVLVSSDDALKHFLDCRLFVCFHPVGQHNVERRLLGKHRWPKVKDGSLHVLDGVRRGETVLEPLRLCRAVFLEPLPACSSHSRPVFAAYRLLEARLTLGFLTFLRLFEPGLLEKQRRWLLRFGLVKTFLVGI